MRHNQSLAAPAGQKLTSVGTADPLAGVVVPGAKGGMVVVVVVRGVRGVPSSSCSITAVAKGMVGHEPLVKRGVAAGAGGAKAQGMH